MGRWEKPTGRGWGPQLLQASKPHHCRAQSLSWAAKASSEMEVPRLEISKEQKGWQGPALTLTILLA